MLAPVGGAPRRPRGPDHATCDLNLASSPDRGAVALLRALRKPINRAGHSLIMDDEPPLFRTPAADRALRAT
jgi:hypothetical protein